MTNKLKEHFPMIRELGMIAVNADAALKNTRSQHVLEKVGFQFVCEDDTK